MANPGSVNIDSAYVVKEPCGTINVDASKRAIVIFLPSLHKVSSNEPLIIRKHASSKYPVTLIGHGTKIGPNHILVMQNSNEMKFLFTGDNWTPQLSQ